MSKFEPDPDRVEWLLVQLDQAEFFGAEPVARMTIPVNMLIGMLKEIQ